MAFFQRLIVASSSTVPRQCMTASVLFGTGDAIAQLAVEKKSFDNYDYVRTLRLGLYGGAIFAPIMSVWFRTLEKVPGVPGSFANVAGKVALDQGLAAPNMLAVFFTATTLMAGGSTADVKKKLDTSYWSTLKTSWAVWIPVQGLNMAFVPVGQRLLFVNVVSLAWNTFLAAVAAGGGDKASSEAKQGNLRESEGEALVRPADLELSEVKVK
ncbi:protein SYM1 [Microstroma glucosiphilum]|uniref:Protein SYM1 n=1 Tax=Pseudomicrostroma glucosiphilum TaxID=1684307 RepID=A0A316U4Y7_9BASI|nr:protein SYM1 [Pseudomicrostroma glucosiphilum]PWN20317.1 protein SYM1 [Pseudomicrostroma glucosiphilum]